MEINFYKIKKNYHPQRGSWSCWDPTLGNRKINFIKNRSHGNHEKKPSLTPPNLLPLPLDPLDFPLPHPLQDPPLFLLNLP